MAKLKYNFINGRFESEFMAQESWNNKSYLMPDGEAKEVINPIQQNINFWGGNDDKSDIPF